MGNIVENPIINSPFEEPKEYWDFSEGTSKIVEKRRPSGYMLPVGKRRKDQLAILATEEFQEMELVNRIRERVKDWRGKYSGVTKITKELLNYWQSEEREKKLFFAQMEAAETAIWLIEAPANETADIKRQINASREYETLPRYALKMATASGKTVVMAMIIAWQVLNKIYNRKDKRFSDAVLVVCPNLTVKERLQVLYPSNEDNYYSKFDLVPPSLLPLLGQGKYFVTNWHLFEPKDDSNTRGVVKKGEESNNAFVRRVLKDLGSKRNILVINDEAHHCYRCNPEGVQSTKKKKISKDIREQNEQATVWVEGLERVQKVREVNLCFDFSATPFYISGSGYQEGTPFPWIMSDFGITDAIECGIIKIPRVPVEDNYAGREPKYLNLWEQIKDKLPKKALKDEDVLKQTSRMLSEVDGALKMLSSQWKETFDEWQGEERKIPPCMIIVCNNTGTSRIIADYIGGANGRSGAIFKELENNEENEYTLRVDTDILRKAEAQIESGETKEEKAERLRRKVATIGEEGREGQNIRCVVSVAMLSEGWDAHNVTQILGLRAFSSQLLIEQVVGRGLRRYNYDDFSVPEYVDVYGIPFQLIPVAKRVVGKQIKQKHLTLIKALPERKHLEIEFPRVIGYVSDVKTKVKVEYAEDCHLIVSPELEPTFVVAKDAIGYRIGRPDRGGPGMERVEDRKEYYRAGRLQSVFYDIACRITNQLKNRFLFPQVLNIVREYVNKYVYLKDDASLEEIGLEKYRTAITGMLSQMIRPENEDEGKFLPILDSFRPRGSTSEVLFSTSRPCYATKKSHVSYVVTDSEWERKVALSLDENPNVISFVKNYKLGLTIPYKLGGVEKQFIPDFVVKKKSVDGQEEFILLEIKGQSRFDVSLKSTAARRWVDAVNYQQRFGRWRFKTVWDPWRLKKALNSK